MKNHQEPIWEDSRRRLVWGVWGVLLLGVTLLFGAYLYTLRHQVREATWAEGKAASHMLQWRLQAQMQHVDDLILHICESFERMGPNLTEKDAVFKGRVSSPKPYEQVLIMGPLGESMFSLPQSLPAWGDPAWLDKAKQHGEGEIFTMVVSKDGQDALARVLPVWSETGQFKGAVVGVLPRNELKSLLGETAQAYGLNLTMWQGSQLVMQSSNPVATPEDAQLWREQLRMTELDLMLESTLRQDAVTARLAMAWQWLLLAWGLIALVLTVGALWLNKLLAQQVLAAAKLKEQEEAAKVRADFLANMSHELRTPMMGVLGAAELLESANETERSRYLTMIKDSGRHLLGLLNNVLDYSRLNANAMPLATQDVAPLNLFREVLQSFVPQSELRRIALYSELDLPADLRLRMDGFRLSQILSNLIGNAFKFTHQGSVSVQAGMEQHDSQPHLWVRITDTGIGLTPEQQQRLFRPFSQADETTSRSYGGTGLGLVIVKQLLDMMGGQIQVRSALDSGTVIQFSMPVQVLIQDTKEAVSNAVSDATTRQIEPQADLMATSAACTASTKQPRILVAEDNDVTRQILSSYFVNTDYQIDFAKDGEVAIALWHQQTYDMAILDCHMPKLDGFAVAQQIRSTESTEKRTPLVALTAATMQEDVVRCKNSGMDDVWFKPISKGQLLQNVQQLLLQQN